MRTVVELARNSLYAIVLYLAPRFANVLIFIFIGRLAGPAQAGIFSLAATYLLIFTAVLRGLDDLVVRQVSREPERAGRYLASFLLLRAGLSIPLYGLLAFVVLVVFKYPVTTALPVLVLGLSIIPDGLILVAQSVMIGLRHFSSLAIVLGGINALKLIAGAIVLARGSTLEQIAQIWLLGSVLGMITLLTMTIRRVGGIRRTDWLSGYGLRGSWHVLLTFIVIAVLVTLEFQIDTVLLSVLQSEAVIGWYNAATTVTATLMMLPQAYRAALYPMLAKYAKEDQARLARLYEKSMYYVGALIIPMSVGLVILSPQIVRVLFGARFSPTAMIVQVLALALFFQFLSELSNRMILVHDRQRRILRFSIASLLINIGLNLWLIPTYSALGTAIARVCSAVAFFALNYWYVKHHLHGNIQITSLVFSPVLASGVMAIGTFLMLGAGLFINIMLSVLIYVMTLWVVNGIPAEDKGLIRQLVRRRLQ